MNSALPRFANCIFINNVQAFRQRTHFMRDTLRREREAIYSECFSVTPALIGRRRKVANGVREART
jgi:hypothetical protein